MSAYTSVALLALVSVCVLGGCVPTRYYPLPISAGEARSTMVPLTHAARDLGYTFWRWDDTVGIQADAQTRLSYLFDASNRYVLCVQLSKRMMKGATEAHLAAGKRISDEIWRRAMSLRTVTPEPVTLTPSVSAEPAAPVFNHD